jgi:Protein of unknown function (DUF2934)
MLFIHQQFQSFLNLGGCKEYPIMAKAKLSKKNNTVKEPVSVPNSTVSTPETNVAPTSALTSAVAAAPVTDTVKTGRIKTETIKTEAKKARKPEIVRSEPRANLVPINIEEEIRRFAYLLSERRGFEPGHEAEDWLAAEHEVRQRYHQQSA